MIFNKICSHRILDFAREQSLSQKELAKHMGITRGTAAKLKDGIVIRGKHMINLRKNLGLDLNRITEEAQYFAELEKALEGAKKQSSEIDVLQTFYDASCIYGLSIENIMINEILKKGMEDLAFIQKNSIFRSYVAK